jgi:hypothetical protein
MDVYKFKNMSFKDFAEYCEINACTGRWSFYEAILCAKIVEEIYQINIKILGIKCRKRTNSAREAAWEAVKVVLFADEIV